MSAATDIQRSSSMTTGTSKLSPLTSLSAALILLLTRTVVGASSPNVARVSYEHNY
ncbi:hypothetical protein P886_1168 [Alteromonadaceae bacterium 2753L.S.0a.02]|nr:hypothetical protein P886_1168 [Alteromonadaceae bacterium 2753L.S.0a.02]